MSKRNIKRNMCSGKEKNAVEGPSKAPPKGRKKKKSNEEEEYDKEKFVCRGAQDLFMTEMKRSVVPERGIDYESFGIKCFKERGWSEATIQPKNAMEDIVREFYANAGFRVQVYMVVVRGKKVCYHPSAINKYFNILCVDDEFVKMHDRKEGVKEMMATLGVEGADWVHKPGGALQVRERDLNLTSKAIHRFICGRMTPTTHKSDATFDRALLNYAIQTGRRVNYGLVVHNAINYVRDCPTSGGLVFPHLITKLCRRAGVCWDVALDKIEPLPLLVNSPSFGRVRLAPSGQIQGAREPNESLKDDVAERLKSLETVAHDMSVEVARSRDDQRVILQQNERLNFLLGCIASKLNIDTSSAPQWSQHPPPPENMED